MSAFFIDLGSLRQGAVRVVVEAQPPEIGLEAGRWSGPVRGEFGVERSGDRISVRGVLHATAKLECVRCLADFDFAQDVPFELFAERAGSGNRGEEEALERDDYMMFHDGRALDLADAVREALLVELPMAPHCREDCRGLCPRCGSNLNDGPCGCGASAAGSTQSDR